MSNNKKISQLGLAGGLTGTELVPIVQGGATVQTTTQDIADLGGGAGVQSVSGTNVDNTDPLNPIINVPTLDEVVTAGNITYGSPVVIDNPISLLNSSDNHQTEILSHSIKLIDGINTPLFEANLTSGLLQKLGVDLATVNDIYKYDKSTNDFRLTLTSGVAVTTGDVVNAQTIYFTPYKGNVISLYNGTKWVSYESNEIILALGVLATGVYDIFCYANAGVPTLEFLAWANDTTRATAITTQNGINVKTGDETRRLVGSFYNAGNKTATVTITNASPSVITYTAHGLTANAPIVFTTSGALPTGIVAGQTYYLASLGTATGNTFNISATPSGALINTSSAGSGTHTATISTYTEDSIANRFLSASENQVNKRMFRQESTTTWDYTTATRRQSNGSILNQLNFIQSLDNIVDVTGKTRAANSTTGTTILSNLGLDTTTNAFNDETDVNGTMPSAAIGNGISVKPHFTNYTGIGKHFIALTEYSQASGTMRWYGTLTNITGLILC